MSEESTLDKSQETLLDQFVKQESDDSKSLTSSTNDQELILKKLLEPDQETIKQEEQTDHDNEPAPLVQDAETTPDQELTNQPASIIPPPNDTMTTAIPTTAPTTTTLPDAASTTTIATPTTTTTHIDSSTTTTKDTPSIPPATSITTFEEIQKQLKTTLDHVEQRNMVSAFDTLSNATSAVVEHCQQLGLTSDDHPYNAIDREQFWAGLNNCWLYALAQQRHEPSSSELAERLTDQHLYSLRDKVVGWADTLEKFGLVDYEMGWWEADILSAIDGILAMNYATAQAAAQAVVAQAAAVLFGEDVNM